MGSKNHKSVIKKVRFLSFSFLLSLFLLPLFIVEKSYSTNNNMVPAVCSPETPCLGVQILATSSTVLGTKKGSYQKWPIEITLPIPELETKVSQTWADVQAAQAKLSAAFRDFLDANTDSERDTARTALDTANQELAEAQNTYRSALRELTIAKSRSAESALSAASKASAAAKQAASEAEAAKVQAEAAAKEIKENPNNAAAINRAAKAAATAKVAAAKAQAQAAAACSAAKAAEYYNSQYPSNVSGSAATSARNSCNDAKEEAQNALTAANETEQATRNKIQATHTENQERIDSATKKIEKQRKFLGFSAVANVAVGAYLLNRQCNPSPTPKPSEGEGKTQECESMPVDEGGVASKVHCYYTLGELIGGPPSTVHGCILGPLALAQGIIHLKQRRSLKKTKNKLKGVTTGIDGSALYAGNVDGAGGTDGIYPNHPIPIDKKEPFHIPDLEVPCANDPTQTCRLTNDGETIVPLDGGPPQSLSEIAGNLPTSSDDPVEQADIDARIQAMEEAIRANQELITQADNANPNNGDDFQSIAGNDPTPAFNFDPLNTGSGSNSGSGTGAGSISGLSGFDDAGGNTPELPAPPEGVYGQDRDFSGSQAFAGNIEGESADDDDDSDVDGNSAPFAAYGRRTASGRSNNNSSNNEKSLPFGADRVATAETNIFGAIHDRYQGFRDSGQFIPPSTSGAVVTPTIPTGAE